MTFIGFGRLHIEAGRKFLGRSGLVLILARSRDLWFRNFGIQIDGGQNLFLSSYIGFLKKFLTEYISDTEFGKLNVS